MNIKYPDKLNFGSRAYKKHLQVWKLNFIHMSDISLNEVEVFGKQVFGNLIKALILCIAKKF